MMIFHTLYTRALALLPRLDSELRPDRVPETNRQSAPIFQVAVSFALVSAFAQLVILAFEKFVLHDYVHQGPDVLWMVPLSNIVIFAVPALLLWLAS